MKKCVNCNYRTEDSINFCPECGSHMEEYVQQAPPQQAAVKPGPVFCLNCGKRIENNQIAFCPSCGTSLKNVVNHQNAAVNQNPSFISSVKSDFKNSETINQMGNVVSSLRRDFNNSETINQAKVKANSLSGTKKRTIIIITTAVAAVLLLFIILISCIHTCDECGDVYFGSKNEISFWGESVDLCDDCYNDLFWF